MSAQSCTRRYIISTLVKPIIGYDKKEAISYEIYEIPDMHLVIDWDIPIRGFKIIEKKSVSENEKIVSEKNIFLCATTLPKWKASADVVRKIVHAKWGIENNGIKDLKDNWYLTHNFHHHPVATFALLLILFMAYNIFYAYVKHQRRSVLW